MSDANDKEITYKIYEYAQNAVVGLDVEEINEERAIRAFKRIEDLGPERFRALIVAIDDPNVKKLLTVGSDRSIEYLVYVLEKGKSRAQQIACEIMGKIGESTLPMLEEVTSYNENMSVRHSAIESMALIGTSSLPNLEAIVKTSDDFATREAAALVIIRIGENAYSTTKLLLNEQEDIRFAIIKAIEIYLLQTYYGLEGSKKIRNSYYELLVQILRNHFHDQSGKVRSMALYTLGQFQLTDVEEIEEALNDNYEDVRKNALYAIRRSGRIDSTNAYLVARAIDDSSGEISRQALELPELRYVDTDATALAEAVIEELIIRKSGLPNEHFNLENIVKVLRSAIHLNPQLRGTTLHRLAELTYNLENPGRRRSIIIAGSLDKQGFIPLVEERKSENPDVLNEVHKLLDQDFHSQITEEISGTDPADIQANAAAQIKLLDKYYERVLEESQTSFRWAVATAVVGLILLLAAIIILIESKNEIATILPVIASILAQFISGTQFYIYNQTLKERAFYHQKVYMIQRYLLANSVCESLDGEAKIESRSRLVAKIAGIEDTELTS